MDLSFNFHRFKFYSPAKTPPFTIHDRYLYL
jgi:hypothetical protein